MHVLAPDSPWISPETVAGFARSGPNDVLMGFAAEEYRRLGRGALVDIGCGAGRNTLPLAAAGWTAVGTDLSRPMLEAGRERAHREAPDARVMFVHAPMEAIPLPDASVDLAIAHGIWNLAESSAQFRLAVAEAARVTRPGGALFVFTFSRNTLPSTAAPVPGETFTFTQFSGRPQVFVTDEQLVSEMHRAGFDPDPGVSLTEYNRRAPGALSAGSGPVIYEAAFRRR